MSEQPRERSGKGRFANNNEDEFANQPANEPEDPFGDDYETGSEPEFEDTDQDGGEDAGRVFEFPRRGRRPEAGVVIEGEILDAEIVDDTPTPGKALALRRAGTATRRGTVQVIATARTVVTHPQTKRTSKAVGRHVWYPLAGLGVVVRQWRDAHGANRYERMMRQAELVGNHEMLLEWEERDVSEKQRRHDRVMDWVRSPVDLLRAIAVGFAATTILLLGLGIVLALAQKDIALVIAPIRAVISAIAFTVWFLSVYGATMLVTATVGFVAYLWQVGRSRTEPPGWIAAPDQGPDREVIPDERAIIAALRNLNLGVLNKKFKEGWQPRWPLATGRDGKGYRTQLELPAGVTVEMINRHKKVLAHNLVRLPVEVWPTEPKNQPGVLDLWVADQGILTDPGEAYPLLAGGETDYFKGVPAGVDQRGELVIGKLMAANYAIAGTMGSGKTSLVIELLCGAMLDPLVDIEVYVMAENVDYDPMRERLSVLVKGDDDEKVLTAIKALQQLREEVTLRGKLLAEAGGDETKVTRALAERDPRMRPKIVVFDECQEMFRHDRHGAAAKDLAIKLMMKARKCAITLLFVTPAPSADNLPRDLAKTVSHRVCFAIGDHQGNDAILGTGAHSRGITAVDLVAGEDIGTAMASGFTTKPGLLRTHWIRKDKQVDQITPIVEHSLGAWTGSAPAPVKEQVVSRDLLTDVSTALAGYDRLKATDVAAKLRDLAPGHIEYESMTGEDLASALEDVGVPVRKLKGTLTVRTSAVLAATADRADDEADPVDLDSEQDDDQAG